MKSVDKTLLGKREREAIETAADAHSDIDLLLISSRGLHWKEEKAVVDALFDIGMEHDVIFSPLFATSDEWENGLFKTFPIYNEITREGAVVA